MKWFLNRQIKSIIESYGMDYTSGKVGLCIDYIQKNDIVDDDNVELMCCSLYYNIEKLKHLYSYSDCDNKKEYKNRIKKSWAEHCEKTGTNPNDEIDGWNNKTKTWQIKK